MLEIQEFVGEKQNDVFIISLLLQLYYFDEESKTHEAVIEELQGKLEKLNNI